MRTKGRMCAVFVERRDVATAGLLRYTTCHDERETSSTPPAAVGRGRTGGGGGAMNAGGGEVPETIASSDSQL